MTSDARTPDDIERDIVDERARMTGTINDLQKKFSLEAIVNDLGSMVRDQGADIGRTISQTVGRNPAAVALVGVGLAWLFLGQGRKATTQGAGRNADQGWLSRRDAHFSDKWGSRAMPRGHTNDGAYHDSDGYWFNDDTGTAQDRRFRRPDVEVAHGAQGAQGDTSNGFVDVIRNGTGAVAGAVSDAAGSLRETAAQMTDRLSHGTEGFSDEARARVLAARRTALDARTAAKDALDRSGRAASNLFEEQPLVVGALAVAVGAAIGGALPHSKIEDDTMGESSDRLFADAQAIFHEERDKAMAVLKAAARDAGGELQDTGSDLADLLPDGKSASDVIVDHVADATSRVLDGAKTEAEHQRLGKRKT